MKHQKSEPVMENKVGSTLPSKERNFLFHLESQVATGSIRDIKSL